MSETMQHETGSGRHTRLLGSLRAIADGVASAAGVEIVELAVRGTSRRRILRIDIDRPGPDGVTIDDCERVSRAIGSAIDEDATLDDDYVLEVSSPGADRPIASDDDVRRNTGRRVEVLTDAAEAPVVGVLRGRSADEILLVDDAGETVGVALERVRVVRQHVGF